MDTAWIGVIGGLIGGVLGASGAVVAQIIGGKNQLKAQQAQLDGQLAASREQWTEDNRARLRDERKALYARYSTAVRNLWPQIFRVIDADGIVKVGEDYDECTAAIVDIGRMSDEIELAAGDAVQQKVRTLQANMTTLRAALILGREPDGGRRRPGAEWVTMIRKALREFIDAARAEVT